MVSSGEGKSRGKAILSKIMGGRKAGSKQLKRMKKLVRESKAGNLAREFRGRLMLEPLEERIVPATIDLTGGEYFAFDVSGGEGIGVIAFNSTDADARLHITYTDNGVSDTISSITIAEVSDTADANGATYQIFTNFGETEAGGTLAFDDDIADSGASLDQEDEVYVTIATGQDFDDKDGVSGGTDLALGAIYFTLKGEAVDGTFDNTLTSGGFDALGSDISRIDFDNSEAIVNIDESWGTAQAISTVDLGDAYDQGNIGNVAASGYIQSITADDGSIGTITAGEDIGLGDDSIRANGGGIGAMTAGEDINLGTLSAEGGIGAIEATDGYIDIDTMTIGGSATTITAGGEDGGITIDYAFIDGDIDAVTTTGAGRLNVAITATSLAVDGEAMFVATDAGADGGAGVVYTIDSSEDDTTATMGFLSNGAGNVTVSLMKLADTDDDTDLAFTTRTLLGTDTDAQFNIGIITCDDNMAFLDEDEAIDLRSIYIEGVLGASGGIDIDDLDVNGDGQIEWIFIEGGLTAGSTIEVESLGALGVGNVQGMTQQQIEALLESVLVIDDPTITDTTDVVITALPGTTTALFITTDPDAPFGDGIYLTAGAGIATAAIDYIDGASTGYVAGNVVLPALGFESTVSVLSITETGEAAGNLIGFIEVEQSVGSVYLIDGDQTTAANTLGANLGSISVGLTIGTIGTDDAVEAADFRENGGTVADGTYDSGTNGVWVINGAANLGYLQVDGAINGDSNNVAIAVTGDVGTASAADAIVLRSFIWAGESDLAGDVFIGDNLLGNVIVAGDIDSGTNGVFAVGVAEVGETPDVYYTPGAASWDDVITYTAPTSGFIAFYDGSIGTSAKPVTIQAASTTLPGGVAELDNDVDLDIVAADNIYATIQASDDVGGNIGALMGTFTGTVRTLGDDTANGNDGDIRGSIYAGTSINAEILAGLTAAGNSIAGASGDIRSEYIVSGNGDITGLIAAADDIRQVRIAAGHTPNFSLPTSAFTAGNMNASLRAGVSSVLPLGTSDGEMEDVLIVAANDVGLADGSTVIVAAGDIEDVSIISGASLTAAGNVNADVLAGVTGAVLGLAINQTTGVVTGGSFNTYGQISNVIVRADGRIGTADGNRNIAAGGGIEDLYVIADGIEGTNTNWYAWGNIVAPAGVDGANSGLEFAELGDDAAAADANITIDINAGAGSTDDPATAGMLNVAVYANGTVGAVSEGYNVFRADGDIEDFVVIAGGDDIDGTTAVTEDVLVNVFAGLEQDGTVVDGAGSLTEAGRYGNIIDMRVLADDNIGAIDASAEDDGFKAAGDIDPSNFEAGTGQFGFSSPGEFFEDGNSNGSGGYDSADVGGNIYVDILAGLSGAGSIYDVRIAADDDVGQTGSVAEGFNLIFASDDILRTEIDAGSSFSPNGNVFMDIVALDGSIEDVTITADDDIGAAGQTLGSAITETRWVSNVVGTITISIAADQIDSDGLGTLDNPQGIIQAGDNISGLYIAAGERAVNLLDSTYSSQSTGTADDNLTGGSFLMSIIAGADGDEGDVKGGVDIVDDKGDVLDTDLIAANVQPNEDYIVNFDGIECLVVLADDDLGEAPANNIISAADSISILDMRAGVNLQTPGGDQHNGTGIPETAGDFSLDIIAGTRLMGSAGITITSGPIVTADTGLPFALNINDGNLPGPGSMANDLTSGDGDQITIFNLDIADGGIYVADDAATTSVAEGNGNLNGTFVAGSDLTLISADINGSLVGDDGNPGGRTLIAGASYTGNEPNGVFLTVQITMPGVFTGPFSAGTMVPLDYVGAIGTNVGDYQAGTVITTGTIQGQIIAGRFDGSGNGLVADGDGITLAEVLAGEEGLADASFVPTTTFGATGDIRLDLLAIGQPVIGDQNQPGQEETNLSDGDFVNFSLFAMNDITGDNFFGSDLLVELPCGAKVTLADLDLMDTYKVDGLTALDAINLNFILANADAVTSIDMSAGDPSTPSTLIAKNSAYGDLEADIVALGYGDGAEGAATAADASDTDGAPNGISGGPIAAGFDPFVLIDSTVLASSYSTAGFITQDPIVAANEFGSLYGNAFGLGSITGDILALDNDATDGLEQGDITVTWIAAGEDINGNIGAQDDIALAGGDGTEGALLPGTDLDIAAGLSANGLIAAYASTTDRIPADLVPGGSIYGDIVAGDDITTLDTTGDDTGLIFIAAQGSGGQMGTGNIRGDIVSGAEDQVDDADLVFDSAFTSDPVGGAGTNIDALVVVSGSMEDGTTGAVVLAGDPWSNYDNFFTGRGGGGFSDATGSYYGSFTGTIVAGAGVDMIIDNGNVASKYNLDNIISDTDGNVNGVVADSDITFTDYTITTAEGEITFNGLIVTNDINFVSAGWGDPGHTGIITGDITAGDDIGTILASTRIGNVGDLIAAGDDIDAIQAGDLSYESAFDLPTSAYFEMPMIDSVGTVAADIFTGGSLDYIGAGGGSTAQLADADIDNDGITGNLFLGEFTGQGDLTFAEAGQVAYLDFPGPATMNIVEIPGGDFAAGVDILLTDGGGSNGVPGFTLTYDGTATGFPFNIDELVIADDFTGSISVDQGSINSVVIDDDVIDRLNAQDSARDAFATPIGNLPTPPAVLLQLFDGDLSRTDISRQFNEDAAESAGSVDYADLLGEIIVRDNIGSIFVEGGIGSFYSPAFVESILGDIGDITVGVDIENATIMADMGTIGDITVGDDLIDSSIVADLGVGDISVQDSIRGGVTVTAISGAIGDILVGTDVDAIGDPADGDGLTDADGVGIADDVTIAGRDGVGNITVVHGDITGGVSILTEAGYNGSVGDIVVQSGDISNGVFIGAGGGEVGDISVWTGSIVGTVNVTAATNIGNIEVGVMPVYAGPGEDGIEGTADDVYVDALLKNDMSIGSIEGGVYFNAILGGIGNVTVSDDVEDGVYFYASAGGVGEIRVYDDFGDYVLVETAEGSGGGLGGLYVAGDAAGFDMYIDGTIAELTEGGYTGSILTGGDLGWMYPVHVEAGAMGDVIVGIDPWPTRGWMSNVWLDVSGDIGDISVRETIEDSKIASYDGSIGNVVAEFYDDLSLVAEYSVGDIVALGLDEGGFSVFDLAIYIDRADGRIGDIIAHGDIASLFIQDFDGSVGDIVSMNGGLSLQGFTIGGSVGDVFASEDIWIDEVTLEAGSIGDDGATDFSGEDTLTDSSFSTESLMVADGLGRMRWDGAPVDGIYSEAGWVELCESYIGGNVGNVRAFADVYYEGVRVGGNVGDTTAFTGSIYGDSDYNYRDSDSEGSGGYDWDYDEGLFVRGSIGDLNAAIDVSGTFTTVTGGIGAVVALTGDILVDIIAGGNIENVEAVLGNILDGTTIAAGGNLGTFADGTGLVAGNFIEDDITVAVMGTIGVIEGRVIGYSDDADGAYVSETFIYEDNDNFYDDVNDLLLVDDDNIFDWANDYFVFGTFESAFTSSGGEITVGEGVVSGSIGIPDDTANVVTFVCIDGIDLDNDSSTTNTNVADGKIVAAEIRAFAAAHPGESFSIQDVALFDVDDVIDVDDVVTDSYMTDGDGILTIIAEGEDIRNEDGSLVARAIGAIRATLDITTDVFVSTPLGGIGTIDAQGGLLGAHDDFGDGCSTGGYLGTCVAGSNFTEVVGGAGNNLEDAIFNARTSVDTVHGMLGITNLKLNVGGDVEYNLAYYHDNIDNDSDGVIDEIDEVITSRGGVGIIASELGGVDICVTTGGSIGPTLARGDVHVHYTGQSVDPIYTSGDVTGKIKTSEEYTGQTSDDPKFVEYSAMAKDAYTQTIYLDTNRRTEDIGDSLWHDTDGDGILDEGEDVYFTVKGSSSGLTYAVDMLFGEIQDIKIVGKGSAAIDSDVDVGVIEVGVEAKNVSVKSIYVDGDLGGFINTNLKGTAKNIEAAGNLGDVVASGTIQKISSGGSIGLLKSYTGDIKTISAQDDIDEIWAGKGVSNVLTNGDIGDILAAKTVARVSADSIGTITGMTVSNITTVGDIDMISGVMVKYIDCGGDIEVAASKLATRISAESGKVVEGGKVVTYPKVAITYPTA